MANDIRYISGIASNLRTPRVASEDLLAFVSYSSRIRAVCRTVASWKVVVGNMTQKCENPKKNTNCYCPYNIKFKNTTNTIKTTRNALNILGTSTPEFKDFGILLALFGCLAKGGEFNWLGTKRLASTAV